MDKFDYHSEAEEARVGMLIVAGVIGTVAGLALVVVVFAVMAAWS